MTDTERCPDDRCGLCGASPAASAAELDHWRVSGESWRAAELRWQDWSAALLSELNLQPPHGLLGDERARLILGDLARAGWLGTPPSPSEWFDDSQRDGSVCPSTRAGLWCEEAVGHDGPCRAVRHVDQAETWQAATKPPKGAP